MFRLDADKKVHFCDGVTRRDFLHAGSIGLLGLTLPEFLTFKAAGAVNPEKDVSCIQLMLVGGPSQLDTWDMKPDAPLRFVAHSSRSRPTFRVLRSRKSSRGWRSTPTSLPCCDPSITLPRPCTIPVAR